MSLEFVLVLGNREDLVVDGAGEDFRVGFVQVSVYLL